MLGSNKWEGRWECTEGIIKIIGEYVGGSGQQNNHFEKYEQTKFYGILMLSYRQLEFVDIVMP